MQVKETTLSNGLTVLSDHMPEIKTVSVGLFTNTGALQETPENNGVAHFLEHMAFKGTKTRSALDISLQAENVGGMMNAFTSREETAYHIKLLQKDLPLAVDIISDILLNPTFPEHEMERERGVILQEINHYAETPDDAVFDHLQAAAFADQPMGRTILGPKENIRNMGVHHLREFMDRFYGGNNMVLAAAGAIEHDQLVELGEKYCLAFGEVQPPADIPVKYTGGLIVEQKELEQAHITLAWPGFGDTDSRRYAANLWSAILGAGMSSRLFQEVREKRGLVYSIYAMHHRYRKDGLFGIYAGTAAKDVPELLDVVKTELHNATQNLTEAELNRAKTIMRASLAMQQESTNARMIWMADKHFTHARQMTVEEVEEAIKAVTLTEVMEIGKTILSHPATAAAVGAVDEAMFKPIVN